MSTSQSLESSAEARRDILLLLGLTLLCYLDKILLGPYAVIDFYDAIEVHFAHFRQMHRLWTQFGPFSWYPFHAGGVPSFVGQHPPYYPAVFLSGVLPIWLLALLWNMAQMFLAGYGTYRFTQILLRVGRRTALIAGALYSLVWISGNVHMVLPSAFPAVFAWTVDLFRADSGRLARLRAALLILAVSLFSFPVLTLPHFPIFHLTLVLFLGRHLPDFKRQVAGVFLVWTGYVLLFLPSIVSLFLYIPFAQREWDFQFPGWGTALLDCWRWIRGRMADQPLLGFLLLSLPLAADRKIRTVLAFFFAMLLVAGVFNSDMKALFAGSFLLKMDLFMFATVLGIAVVMLTALVIERQASGQDDLKPWVLLAAIALLPLFGAAHKVLGYAFLLGAGVSAALLFRSAGRATPKRSAALQVVLLAACLAGGGMMLRQQSMTTGMYVPYAKGYLGHPELTELARRSETQPFRVACLDVHPGVIQSYGLDTVGGKSPLFNKYYKEYVREALRPQLPGPEQLRQFDDLWRQLYLTRNKIDHDQRPIALPSPAPRTAADLDWAPLLAMGVSHVVSSRPVPGMENRADLTLSPGLQPGDLPWPLSRTALGQLHALPLWIYALHDAQPMGRLVRPVVLPAREAVLAAIGAADAMHLAGTAYLAQEDVGRRPIPAETESQAPAPGQCRLASWSPDRLVFEGRADAPCLLLVANNFDPRWTARGADGEPLPLLRADHAFQGVLLEKSGPFCIELRFATPLIWWLHVPAALGVLLFFVGVGLPVRGGPQAGSIRPEQDLGAPLPALAWRKAMLTGLLTAALWALAFSLFVLKRQPGPQAETYPYALSTIPLIGLGIALWTRRLLRRL